MSGNIQAKRYDLHSRPVEVVTLEIDRYAGEIHIFVRGEKTYKLYVVNAESFRAALDRADEQFRERGGTRDKV